jgi:Zn-dependent protease with chaperone function
MDMLRQASLFALLTLMLGVVPLVMAVVYVIRPTERHLALMRPLSLAGLFAAMAGGVLGLINVLRFVWTRELTADTYRVMAVGAAESLVTLLVGFASLTVAWLLVAVGMGRQGDRL